MTEAAAEQGFDPKNFMHVIRRFGHGGTIGIEYRDHGGDWCELALPYSDKLVGMEESGIIASGPIVSMMDVATSIAIWVRLGRFRPQVTLDLRIDYLRPAEPGRTVIGRGECYAVKRRVAFVRGIAHDGDADDPVAHVTGSFISID
jgi:uncharacterized protein (TIGR00369 family)